MDSTPSKRDIFRGEFDGDVHGVGIAPCSEERVEGRASSRPGEVLLCVFSFLFVLRQRIAFAAKDNIKKHGATDVYIT